jgi:hypothetical protein
MAIRVLRDHGVCEVCIRIRSDPDGIYHPLIMSGFFLGSYFLPHVRRRSGRRGERDSEGISQG